MLVSRKRKNYQPEPKKRYVANRDIAFPKIRVIDENGVNMDVMNTADAQRLAEERGKDLVIINPKAEPPIAKLLNFGQFKYQKEKEERKARAQTKTVEVKGIRLTARIGDHDKETRLDQAVKFLDRGDKVQIEIIMRGRDHIHHDLIKQQVHDFIKDLGAKVPTKIEQPLVQQGNKFIALVSKGSA
jgi:translation initiation factor IF-3